MTVAVVVSTTCGVFCCSFGSSYSGSNGSNSSSYSNLVTVKQNSGNLVAVVVTIVVTVVVTETVVVAMKRKRLVKLS